MGTQDRRTETIVLLVRHAEPETPLPGASYVADNDRALTAEGRRAAEALAVQLASLPIRAVYSSPYRRARETVEPIAVHHGVPVHVIPDLRERRVGGSVLEAAAFVEALERLGNEPDFALAGGESTREVQRRVWRALEHIRNEVGSGYAVAGTHGGVISNLRWSLGDEFTVEDALAVPMPAVFALAHDGKRWRFRDSVS